MLSANGLKLAIVSVTPTVTCPPATTLPAPRPRTAAPAIDAVKIDRIVRDVVCIVLSSQLDLQRRSSSYERLGMAPTRIRCAEVPSPARAMRQIARHRRRYFFPVGPKT